MLSLSADAALKYHNATKHYPNRYAKSLGYLDWANQPNPYRYYEGAKKIYLNRDIQSDLNYNEIFKSRSQNKPTLDALSSFLRYSLGLAAIKSYDGMQWELRVNASSGNLHPTECYIITDLVDGVVKLYHYVSFEHCLEELCKVDASLNGGFVAILTSVVYREMWKYGERAYRYANLDFGHAYRCLEVSAKLNSLFFESLNIKEKSLDKMLGFDNEERFVTYELEHSDIAIAIGANDIKINSFDTTIVYEANHLAQKYQRWEIIEEIISQTADSVVKPDNFLDNDKKSEKKATEVILKRRSAREYDSKRSFINKDNFFQILNSAKSSRPKVDFVLYLHNVEGLKRGLYFFQRSKKYPLNLKKTEEIEKNCFFLKEGDFTIPAKNLSCMQDIAADSAFALSMIADLKDFNAINYKERLFECGRIGQQLYLEATSLGYSATGIGCFFDDSIHALIEAKKGFEVLYNFTIGKEIPDARVMTTEPYSA